MVETPAGFPRPVITESDCTHCGLCYRVCGGRAYQFALPETEHELFHPKPRRVLLTRARDPRLHALGQSGGTSTALMAHLLATGRISHALVTRMPHDGSCRPQPFLATDVEQLLEAVGSKYCLVPLCSALVDLPTEVSKLGAVGLGCHVHGLRNLQAVQPNRWADRIEFVIGLFCLQAAGYLSLERFLRAAGQRKPVARMLHRYKTEPGVRGVPAIEYTDGALEFFDQDFLWSFFHPEYCPLRCRFCFDKLNAQSDIALGDPVGYDASVASHGMNLVAVHSQRGEQLIEDAERDGVLEVREAAAAEIHRHQKIAERRTRVLTSYGQWLALGRRVPEVAALEAVRPRPGSTMIRTSLEFLYRIEAAPTRRRAEKMMRRHMRLWRLAGRVGGWMRSLKRLVRR